jgi:hypothetical protein
VLGVSGVSVLVRMAKPLSILIANEQLEVLRHEAQRLGMSVEELVRVCVLDFVRQLHPGQGEQLVVSARYSTAAAKARATAGEHSRIAFMCSSALA